MSVRDPTPGTIAAALAGDESAWRSIVGSTGGYLLGLARRMVRDPVEAEDVVQDIHLRLQRHLGRYDPSWRSGPRSGSSPRCPSPSSSSPPPGPPSWSAPPATGGAVRWPPSSSVSSTPSRSSR